MYSNTNYLALGLLVQALRYKPFVQVMREEVLEPFGLKNTSLDRLDLHETGLLHGYVALRGARVDITDNAFAAGSPAAGAVSTMADVNDFMAGLFQGRAVSAGSLREMKTARASVPMGWDCGSTATDARTRSGTRAEAPSGTTGRWQSAATTGGTKPS
jgi:D-alanyl-D-alanine carboxypeptidase